MENALPVKSWGLDPLYWTHVKLFVRDVLQLKNYSGFKGVYAISNHPIAQVLVVGYIVKVDKREKLTTYGVDDGTGCLSCCMWHNQNNDLVEATFGDLVTVMGKISVFREERQITASSFYIETDPNVEVFHWLEVMKLREIYEKPFEVSENPETKTVTKPWLKNELEIEIDRLEESLKSAIAEYLEITDALSFTLDTLCGVNKVMEIMRQLTSKYRERSSDKKVEMKQPLVSNPEVRQVIKQTLRKLDKDGIVYCKPITDYNHREYEFISIKKDLSPRIVNVIKEICHSQGESSCGIALNKIVSNLKSLEKYKNVPRDRVKVGLEHLMNNGDIYETRQGHYRIA
ncbi:CST complex subunit STN1 [Paramuricea clavata]|uniref:CST complex subunit STN1 n=1 Tax=Paramuricea clavata TaxID=317549 RepID=A0A6S7J3X3_PARCT|nr:CST complex subunit STN1 [Paramuricea clavata]